MIEQQQRDEDDRPPVQADAEAEPQRHRRYGKEIIGRRAQEGEADEEDEGDEERVAEPVQRVDHGDAAADPISREREGAGECNPGRGRAHAQYAFSDFTSANGVIATM